MSALEPTRRRLAATTATIDHGIAVVCIILLAFVACANGAEMLLRGIFSQSLVWLYETNLLIANWLYFLGMSLVYYRNKDITLDFMLLLLKGRFRGLYLIAINLVGIGTFIVIAVFAGVLMRVQMPFRTPGYGIPDPLYTVPVGLSAVFMALNLAAQSLNLWCGRPPFAGVQGRPQ